MPAPLHPPTPNSPDYLVILNSLKISIYYWI